MSECLTVPDCPEVTAMCVNEGDTFTATLQFLDEDGAIIPTANVAAITLDLFRTFDGVDTTINSRATQSVLNVNGGTYYDTLQTGTDVNGEAVEFNFRQDFAPEDSPFLKDNDAAPDQREVHVANFRFTTVDGQALTRTLHITVTNVRRFSVL